MRRATSRPFCFISSLPCPSACVVAALKSAARPLNSSQIFCGHFIEIANQFDLASRSRAIE